MSNKKERWVIKAGSSLVAGIESGINSLFIENLVSQVDYLIKKNVEVIIVSSGAVAKGMQELNLKERPSTLHLLQAAAAVGQMGLVNAYQREFNKFDVKAAQVLISHDDIRNRKRYLNARRSLDTLLELKVIPIVNENDSVATEEISFGDNDTLAGALVGLVGADKFIMLTDQVGICSGDPTKDSNVNLLSEIDLDDPSIDLSSQLEGSSGQVGRGGMKTKIKASRIALAAGAKTWVADGRQENTLKAIFNNEKIGTILLSQRSQRQSRKTWIASLGSPAGSVCLDNGAVLAVNKKGSSLLAAGIIKVSGDFDTGALIVCEDENGQEIARGLTNLNSKDIDLVKGLNSKELLEKLDQAADEEIIHRNNLILS
jgi:glutamate 5-kinase|tara:strand:- start:214 stop:1329 length:1116 start_codon:yes stop_codon:yes gene_type:complete